MSNEKEKNDGRKNELEEIKEMGSVSAFDGRHKIFCLTVIGEIEGHNVLPEQNKTTKYEHVIPQLVAIEESRDIEGLLIILNTVGGDVEAWACNSRADFGYEKAHGFVCFGRRPFNRRSACGIGKALLYSALRHYDGTPRKNNRSCYRRAADYESLCAYAGENHRFCGKKFGHLGRVFYRAYDEHRRNGDRRRLYPYGRQGRKRGTYRRGGNAQ